MTIHCSIRLQQDTSIKKPQIMLRTALNFSNRTNRVSAYSLRHQTAACESITECSRVPQLKDENVWLLIHGNAIKVHICLTYQFITVTIESGQGKEWNWAFLTALGNRLAGTSPQQKLRQESGELYDSYSVFNQFNQRSKTDCRYEPWVNSRSQE